MAQFLSEITIIENEQKSYKIKPSNQLFVEWRNFMKKFLDMQSQQLRIDE
jgi:hypothetical protein